MILHMIPKSYEFLAHHMWAKGNLSYKLWPQQIPIYDGIRNLGKDIPLVVVLCARQYGKSHLGLLMAIEDCLRYPDSCILVVGPTLKQATDIVAPRIRRIMTDAPEGLIRRSKSESKYYVGDSELVIGGFDQNSSSQRGKTVQNIYIEEVVDSHPDDYLDSMRSDLGPALTHSDGGKMIFLTTPPKIPDHPFIVDTMVQASLFGSLYTYTIKDNKAITPDQYKACIVRCGGEDTIDFRREYMCEIVRDASLVVVPEFDEEKHVEEFDWPMGLYHQVTIDWGGVRDKTVALWHTYDYAEDRHLYYDELVWEPNTETARIVKAIKEKSDEFEYIRDWSYVADVPGQLQVDLNHSYEFTIRTPPKVDWKAGVNKLNMMFSQGKLVVHPRCQFLINSLRSGTFNKHRTDFERTHALGHCDAIAAAMYGVRSITEENPYSSEMDQFTGYNNVFVRKHKQDAEMVRLRFMRPNFRYRYGTTLKKHKPRQFE